MHKNLPFNVVGIVAVVAFICVLVASVSTVKAQTACVSLPDDLSSGMSDSSSMGPIFALQNYLKSLGYLGATPNGYFGPATLSGVKIYQTMNNVPASGYVGPLTRASISKKTCVTGTAAVSNAAAPSVVAQYTASAITSVPIVAPVSVVTNTDVTSPATGQVLSVGSPALIRWSKAPSGSYNISLEQPGGAGAGFIALNQSPNIGGNQYLWSVGKVFSSQTNTTQNVAAGTYRIRLQGVSIGPASADETSGWFTIVAPVFAASSVMPSSAPADDATSVALFGSGLNSAVSIYFDTNYSSLRATNTYVSPDGTLLVFTIPTSVSPGPHTLIINNGQSLSPASLSFVVSTVR